MKRNELIQTLRSINLIRKEKTPPIASYCIMLALATQDDPMTSGEINKAVDEPNFGGGTLDRLVEKGFILKTRCDDKKIRYSITDKGMAEVRRLVSGKLPPTQVEIRRAAIVPFNPNAMAV